MDFTKDIKHEFVNTLSESINLFLNIVCTKCDLYSQSKLYAKSVFE